MRILSFIALAIFSVVAWGIFQLVMGVLGIDHYFGVFGALAALFAAFCLRFTLPLSIGAFFGITEVLEWHWFFALILCMPGLLMLVPSVIATRLEPYNLKYDPFARYRQAAQEHETSSRANDPIEGEYEVVDDQDKNNNNKNT